MRALLAIGLLGVSATSASAQGATVFLQRGGTVIDRNWDGSLVEVAIPKFGGTAKTWAGLVTCVQEKFAAFDVEVVDQRPTGASSSPRSSADAQSSSAMTAPASPGSASSTSG